MSDETYFQGWEQVPFPASAIGYHPGISWWLAQCSKLSYEIKMITARTLKQAGFQEVVFFDTKGTQAFLAKHPGVQGGGEFAVLAFRGTEQDSVDILTDMKLIRRVYPDENLIESTSEPNVTAKFLKLYVHAGFLEGIQNVWGNELRPEVKAMYPDESSSWYGFPGVSNAICKLGNTPVYFTGHSLGGALATLATYKAMVYKQHFNFAGLYTFGSPRTVQERLAKRINSDAYLKGKLHRVVNYNDLVPRVPIHLPPFLEYQHIDQLVYFDGNSKKKPISSTFEVFLMDTKVLLLTFLELLLWLLTLHQYTPKTIECHMINKYIRDLERDL